MGKIFRKFIFIVLAGCLFLFIQETKAASFSSCNVAPFSVNPGEDITISAVIDFTASDIWAVIENESGILESHYSLDADDATHYSKAYTTSFSAAGRYDIKVSGTESGTGDEAICNASTGQEWIRKSLNEVSYGRRSLHSMLGFNGKLWVIGGSAQDIYDDVWNSDDGLNWLKITDNAPWGVNRAEFKTIIFDNKIWLMGGYKLNSTYTVLTFQNDVWNTSDGYNWNEVTDAAGWSGRSLMALAAYNGKLWISGGCTHVAANLSCDTVDDDVWYSTDGDTWTQATAEADWNERGAHEMINFDDGESEKLYLVGGITMGPNTALDDVWSSTDGSSWSLATDAPGWEPRYLFDLESYNGKLWLLGGYTNSTATPFNDIWTTTNGSSWTEAKSDVTLGGVGYQASTWTHWAPRRSFDATLFDDGSGIKFWLSGGAKNTDYIDDIWKSSNGTDWQMVNTHFNAEFGMRFDPGIVVYNNRIWLMGGWAKSFGTERINTNDVWSSDDGISWRCDFGPYTAATQGLSENCLNESPSWTPRWDHRLVVFDEPGDSPDKGEQIFLVGGCTSTTGFNNCPTANELNDVWSLDEDNSTYTWSQETSGAAWYGRYGPTVTVFDDKIYMTGGYRQTEAVGQQVWYTSDGASWSQTSNAAWAGRMEHQAIVYGSKLWIMGGWGGTRRNDVWYSTDPINAGWTQATASAAWPGRYTFLAVNYNDHMWVISGNVEGGALQYDDVWNSTDGVTWNNVTNDGGFIARDFFAGTVFQDRIWLTAGDSRTGGLNDVWATRYEGMSYYVTDTPQWSFDVQATVEPEISLILSGNSCGFGLLTPNAIQACGYDVTIFTNNPNGYTGLIRQNHGFEANINGSVFEIHGENDTPLQIDASGTLSAENGEYGVGIQTEDSTDWPEFTGVCSDYNNQGSVSLPAKAVDWSTAADPDQYLGDDVDNVFAYSSGPVDGVNNGVTSICHGARITWDAPPGSYTQTVTITVIGNF